jgi:hypothetical protein
LRGRHRVSEAIREAQHGARVAQAHACGEGFAHMATICAIPLGRRRRTAQSDAPPRLAPTMGVGIIPRELCADPPIDRKPLPPAPLALASSQGDPREPGLGKGTAHMRVTVVSGALCANSPHTHWEPGRQLRCAAQHQSRQGVAARKLPAKPGRQLWQGLLPTASDLSSRRCYLKWPGFGACSKRLPRCRHNCLSVQSLC